MLLLCGTCAFAQKDAQSAWKKNAELISNIQGETLSKKMHLFIELRDQVTDTIDEYQFYLLRSICELDFSEGAFFLFDNINKYNYVQKITYDLDMMLISPYNNTIWEWAKSRKLHLVDYIMKYFDLKEVDLKNMKFFHKVLMLNCYNNSQLIESVVKSEFEKTSAFEPSAKRKNLLLLQSLL